MRAASYATIPPATHDRQRAGGDLAGGNPLSAEEPITPEEAVEDTAVEIFPFVKGKVSPVGKDFTVYQTPVDVDEPTGDEDPKDSSAIESAPSSELTPPVPEVPPAPAEKVPVPTTTADSKPTSSTAPTTSPGKQMQPVAVPIPNSSSPSAEK